MVAEFPVVRLRRAGVSRAVLLELGERWSAASEAQRVEIARTVQELSLADLRYGAGLRSAALERAAVEPGVTGGADTRPVVRPTPDNHNAATLAAPADVPAENAASVTVPLGTPAQDVTEDYAQALDTVASARAYVREHPDRAAQLLAAELTGQARASLVEHLQRVVERGERG